MCFIAFVNTCSILIFSYWLKCLSLSKWAFHAYIYSYCLSSSVSILKPEHAGVLTNYFTVVFIFKPYVDVVYAFCMRLTSAIIPDLTLTKSSLIWTPYSLLIFSADFLMFSNVNTFRTFYEYIKCFESMELIHKYSYSHSMLICKHIP